MNAYNAYTEAEQRIEDEDRQVRFYDSSNGQMRGTFPPSTEGIADTALASRQCKRAAWRAHNFNQITQTAYVLPRRERRRLSRTMEN